MRALIVSLKQQVLQLENEVKRDENESSKVETSIEVRRDIEEGSISGSSDGIAPTRIEFLPESEKKLAKTSRFAQYSIYYPCIVYCPITHLYNRAPLYPVHRSKRPCQLHMRFYYDSVYDIDI